MRNPFLISAVASGLLLSHSLAGVVDPEVVACETFGDSPTEDLGYTTNPHLFDNLETDFFQVLPNDQTRFASIGGGDGTQVFAAEDIDSSANPILNLPQSLGELTTASVNLTGLTNTTVRILIAAPGDSNGDNTAFVDNTEYDYSPDDFLTDQLIVEYSSDGTNFSEVVRFAPSSTAAVTSNQVLTRSDTFANVSVFPGIGSSNFSEVRFPVVPGPNAQVRIKMQTNGSGEFFAIDSIYFLGDASTTAAPVITGVDPTPLTYEEGSGSQVVAPTLSITDLDSTTLNSATITISSGYNSSEDTKGISTFGNSAIGSDDLSFSGNSLTISGPATLAEFMAVLQTFKYTNTNTTNPDTTTRQITFTITDDQNNIASAIREIEINNVIETITTLPYMESFETDGQGVRYFADGAFGEPADDNIFGRTEPGLAATDGSWAFAIEDAVIEAASEPEAIYFNLNTPTTYPIEVRFLAAAPDGANYDSGDFIEAQTSVDGSTWTTVGAFHATSDGTSPTVSSVTISQDFNLDGFGELNSTILDNTFREFAFPLPSTESFQLRIAMQSNSNGERLLVDKVQVVVTPPTLSGLTSVVAPENQPLTYVPNVTGSSELTISAGTLPTGMSLDETTGIISGTPTGSSSYPFTLTATNPGGEADLAITFEVVTPIPLPESVDATELSFSTLGDSNWFGQASVTFDSSDAARSPYLVNNQSASMTTTVEGPIALSYRAKTSSEANYDFLKFYLDGQEQVGAPAISGEIDWQLVTISIPVGTHTLRWSYEKDFSVSNGQDAAWVDDIQFSDTVDLPTALDTTNFIWSTSGSEFWVGQTSTNSDGFDAAQATLGVGYSFSSSLETTVTGEGTLSFWWKTLSNENEDSLRFYLNDVEHVAAPEISGDVDWQQVIIPIPPGTHALEWILTKEAFEDEEIMGWVDQVDFNQLLLAVDNSGLALVNSGEANWAIVQDQANGNTFDGVDSAQSGNINHSQSSTMTTTISGEDFLSFWWKTSTEANFDHLIFTINGVEIMRQSGENDWTYFETYLLGPGPHNLSWTYDKDGTVDGGQDSTWIDQVLLGANSLYANWAEASIASGLDRSFDAVSLPTGISNGITYVFGSASIEAIGGNPSGTGQILLPANVPSDVDLYLEVSNSQIGTPLVNWNPVVAWEEDLGATILVPTLVTMDNGIATLGADLASPFFLRYRAVLRTPFSNTPD
ncbi:MAG: Ig domain-containing protein [Roseibacillus sp.]